MQIYKADVDPPNPEAIVMLKRNIGNNRVCFSSLKSKEVAHYVESLPTHTVKVKYTVIYDFYQIRTFRLENVGDFPHDYMRMGIGSSGLTGSPNAFEPCFSW
jgi:hypothetical protein